MKIKLIIFNPQTNSPMKNGYNMPDTMEFKGNYAIETLLIKLSEKFFGSKVSAQIEELLKNRIGE